MITDEREAFKRQLDASVFSTVTRHRGEEENEQVEKAERPNQQQQQNYHERMSRPVNWPASSAENAPTAHNRGTHSSST